MMRGGENVQFLCVLGWLIFIYILASVCPLCVQDLSRLFFCVRC